MAFKQDFAFVVAKELRRCVNTIKDEETPYLELLREKIASLSEEIALVRSYQDRDCSNLYIEEILHGLCEERRFCRRVFKDQKTRLRNLNIKFYKFLIARPGVLQLQDFDFRDVPVLRQEWVHFNKLYAFIKSKVILCSRREYLMHKLSIFKRNLRPNSNIYEFLPVDDSPADSDDSEYYSSAEEASESSFISNIKDRVKFIFSSQLRDDSDRVYRETTVPRNANLLTKLKHLIRSFTLFRTNSISSVIKNRIMLGIPAYTVGMVYAWYRNSYVAEEAVEMQEFAYPQMDADAHGENEPTQIDAGNVTITEARDVSAAVTAPASSCRWGKLVSSDVIGSYKEMTDRWLKCATFEWNKDHCQNAELDICSNNKHAYLDLPFDAIYSTQYNVCDVPNTLPFRVHRYWRGDMDVRIQINSNKFQVGQLQCSWFYEPWLDGKFDLRRHYASASQTDHVLISAGSSNEAVLKIPFKHHLPFISTKSRSDYISWMRTGRLYVRVINPLIVSANGQNKCYGSIFIRFTNCEFTGQISGKIDAPNVADFQMNSVLGTIAENVGGVLGEILSKNRDNPADVRPFIGVVPSASHSWCIGNGQAEPINPLRLQSNGEVRHLDNTPYEMSTLFAARKYGLICTKEWNKDQLEGTQIFACNASPELETSLLYYKTGGAGISETVYYFPPVSVVTSMYQYWRGTLEFRFDIVASQFHTGRLLVGYVPGATSDTKVSMNDILSGPHMIFTLQESQQFTYAIPYIADRPMWSKNYMGNYKESASIPPSRLYMYVLNPLVPMESVPNKVYINVYMRAGNDFEVMIPTQPSLGLGFDPDVIPSRSDLARMVNGYTPWYLGTWHSFKSGVYLVSRWGSASDQIAHFDPKWATDSSVSKIHYYQVLDEADALSYWDGNAWQKASNFIGVWQGKATMTGSYVFLVPCVSEDAASAAALAYERSGRDGSTIPDEYLIKAGSTVDNAWTSGNIWLVVKTVLKPKRDSVSDDIVIVSSPQGERENSDNVITPPSSVTSSNHGMAFFGENFGDMKDLCRRYQTYGVYVFDSANLKDKLGACSCIIPMIPQGLLLDIGTKVAPLHVANRCREGHIPTVLSAYRYYRGGVRVRLITPKGFDVQMWIQHRPDRRLRSTSIIDCTKVSTAEGVANHSYASYIQDTNVNTIIEVEVPFYQNGCFGLLQRPILNYNNKHINSYNESLYMSLGELSVGILALEYDTKTIKHSQLVICYSLADDFQFSTFQGFPPMFVLDNMTAVPQMHNVWRNIVGKATPAVAEAIKPEIKNITNAFVQEAGEYISNELKVVQAELNKASLVDVFNAPVVRTFFSHLCQMLANMNLKSCCIGLASVLVELGLWSYSCMDTIIQHLIKFFSSLSIDWSGNEPNMPDVAEEATPQSDLVAEASTGLITVMWMAICSLSGVTKGIGSNAAWSKILVQDLGGSLRSANALFAFVRNLFSVLESMKVCLFGYLSPKYKAAELLEEKYAEMKAWTDEVITLEDPQEFEDNKFLPEYKLRVTAAYILGQHYYKNIGEYKGDIAKHIISIYIRVKDLREKLVEFGDDGFVRKEPFTLWMYGAAGVGKTHLIHDLSMMMLRHANITTRVPPVCVIDPQANHWDSCQNNPVICIDDIYNIQSGNILERHLECHYQLFSPVVLTPPKARVDDKGRPYNPDIAIFTSNYEYPVLPNIYNEAIWRRRHMLLDVCIDSEGKKDGCPHCAGVPINEVDPAYMRDYHHLKFRFAVNVVKKEDGYSAWMKYDEFCKVLLDKFTVVRERNLKLYQSRLEEILAFISAQDLEGLSRFADLKQILKARMIKKQSELIENSLLNIVKNKTCDWYKYLRNTITPWFARTSIAVPQMNNNPFDVQNRPGTRISTSLRFDELSKIIEDYLSPRKYHIFPCPDMSRGSLRIINVSHAGTAYGYINGFKEKFPEESARLGNTIMGACLNVHYYDSIDESEMFLLAAAACIQEHYNLTGDMGAYSNKYIARNLFNIFGKISSVVKTSCTHLDMDSYDVDDCVTEECDDTVDFCIWRVPYVRYAYYKRVLEYNPRVNVILKSNTESLIKELPEVFQPRKIIRTPTISLESWNDFIQSLKREAYERIQQAYSCVAELFSKCSKLARWVLPMCGAILLALGTMTAVSTAKYGVCKMAAKMVGAPEPAWTAMGPVWLQDKSWVEPQHGKYETIRSSKISLNASVPVARPQGECPQLQVAISRLRKNMFRIMAVTGDKFLSVESFVLEGRKLLMLAHYLEEFKALPSNTRYFGRFHLRSDKYEDGTFGIPLNLWDLECREYGVRLEDGSLQSNFVVMWLPINVPECKSLVPFIAQARQHVGMSSEGQLLKNDGTLIANLNICRENARPLVIRATEHSSKVVLQDMYSYRVQGRGMCGSVLLSCNLERPIVGIHVAGIESGNTRGIAEILTYETFRDLPINVKQWNTEALIPNMLDEEFAKINVESLVFPLGCTDSTMTAHQSGETQYVPSLIQGVFPVETEPNPLHPLDPRLPAGSQPLRDGVAHMGRPPINFPKKDIEDAEFDLRRVIVQNVKPVRMEVGVISMQDAVCGNSEIYGFEPLEWSTSPGFPLRFLKDKSNPAGSVSGKKWLFDLTETEKGYVLNGLHPKLQNQIMIEQACRQRGIKPFTVFIDCLKDTCVPSDKCRVPGKTRIFSISPVQYTIVFKQYFLDFMASYQKARLNAEHGIGINVNSTEWTELATYLQEKGDKIICGDYKNFGPGLMLVVAEAACRIILEWYAFHGATEEEQVVRRVLISELLSANHLCTNLIYVPSSGIPSGSPITAPLNSLVNSLYIRIIWKYTTNLSFSVMHDNCNIVTYGDDVCINVSDECVEAFNTITMHEAFRKYDIVFTDVDKDGEIVPYHTIDTAQFLKCGFIPHPKRAGLWLAPLDKISIQGCANWISTKNMSATEATVTNAEQCLMLSHSWGEEYYNTIKDKLELALVKENLTFRYTSWEDLDFDRYSEIKALPLSAVSSKTCNSEVFDIK